MEEKGILNLYNFNYNTTLQYIDPDGKNSAIVIAIVVLILYPDMVNAPGPGDQTYSPGNSSQGAMDAMTGVAISGTLGKGFSVCCKYFGKTKPITFGHGARHLTGTGLSQVTVENAIKQQVQALAKNAKCTASFRGKVQVGGKTIEYRAFTLQDGTINIGTYYPL